MLKKKKKKNLVRKSAKTFWYDPLCESVALSRGI